MSVCWSYIFTNSEMMSLKSKMYEKREWGERRENSIENQRITPFVTRFLFSGTNPVVNAALSPVLFCWPGFLWKTGPGWELSGSKTGRIFQRDMNIICAFRLLSDFCRYMYVCVCSPVFYSFSVMFVNFINQFEKYKAFSGYFGSRYSGVRLVQ